MKVGSGRSVGVCKVLICFGFLLSSGLAWAGDLALARRALEAGRYEEAAAALGRAEDPREALLLARVRLAVGDRAGAGQAVRRALAQLPPAGQGEALTLRGELEALEGQDEAALKTWAKAQEVDPGAREARLRRGELLLRLGRREEGRALLDAFAEEYNEDPPRDGAGLMRVGVAVWRLEFYEDANSVLRDATEADPTYLPAWVAWGDLFLEKYNTEDASFAYEAALKRNPRYSPALVGMARVTLERDYDLKAVQGWLDKALAVNPAQPEAVALRAELQIDDGDYEGAQRTLREALKINPRHQKALWLMAASAWLRGDQKGYLQHKKAVLAINPRDAAFLTQMARMAARAHRYQDAILFCKEALSLDKDHWPAFVELGISYTRVGDDKQGQAFLTKAHENDPFHARAFHMVNLYEQTLPAYRFVERGGLRFRFHKDEQAVLEEVIPPLAAEAMEALGRRYRYKPKQAVHVEVFRDRETFSVRSVGLPNISPHGICFGAW
jgi:tetratricopeptide (TPR) repeat protein